MRLATNLTMGVRLALVDGAAGRGSEALLFESPRTGFSGGGGNPAPPAAGAGAGAAPRPCRESSGSASSGSGSERASPFAEAARGPDVTVRLLSLDNTLLANAVGEGWGEGRALLSSFGPAQSAAFCCLRAGGKLERGGRPCLLAPLARGVPPQNPLWSSRARRSPRSPFPRPPAPLKRTHVRSPCARPAL
jgi:hypothetical protein